MLISFNDRSIYFLLKATSLAERERPRGLALDTPVLRSLPVGLGNVSSAATCDKAVATPAQNLAVSKPVVATQGAFEYMVVLETASSKPRCAFLTFASTALKRI